jgi:hypothetical protein
MTTVRSDATTVEGYLAELEDDRRATIGAVRDVVNDALPEGYEEGMTFGMITWYVPLERYPDTYNGQPLGYVALAAQRRYNSLYLNPVYGDTDVESEFRRRWEAGGRKLDMGKSCVRFKKVDDLDLGLVREVVARTPVDEYIGLYERSRAG